jgi:hypothetical protein
MQVARRLIVAFSCVITVWVFASVAGALLDPAHAAFWSSSLMWSFLSTLLVAPALVIMFDRTWQRRRTPPSASASEASSRRAAERRSRPETAQPFIEGANAAYPVSDERGASKAEAEGPPDWVEPHAT